MAQGEFTKEEAKRVRECFGVIMDAIPKRKIAEVFGAANDVDLFLSAAGQAAPEKKSKG